MTHPIFADIGLGNLAKVQRRVLTTPEVLEERGPGGTTPLMHAIWMRNDQIARWLIHHRSHSLGAVSNSTWTPLHWGCLFIFLNYIFEYAMNLGREMDYQEEKYRASYHRRWEEDKPN